MPGHDFVFDSKNKFILSVKGDMKVVKSKDLINDVVSYFGPTYIAIRSTKHPGSLTFHHVRDMNKVRSLSEFTNRFQDKSSKVKKVMIVTVDRGPDENPRYINTTNWATDYSNEGDLHAYFVATSAPGRSIFKRVERKMSNLSKKLSGVTLPHDHFGIHLDNNNNTVDEELERKNFEHSGEILAELWSKLVINDNPVVSEFVGEEPSDITVTKSEEWKANHVRE